MSHVVRSGSGSRNRSGSRSPRRGAWILVVLLLAAPAAAEPKAAAPAPDAEPEPLPISIASIAVESSVLVGRLRAIDLEVEPTAAQQQIATLLPPLEQDVKRRKARLEERIARAHRSEIEGLRSVWETVDATLVRWNGQLVDRLDAIEDLRGELLEAKKIWAATATHAAAEQAPEEIVAQIREAQKSLSASRSRVRSSRDEALELQNRVVGLREQVEAQLDAIAKAREQVFTHLLELGAPPIWSVRVEEARAASRHLSVVLDDLRSAFVSYPRSHQPRLWLHLLGTGALIWVSVRARRSALRMAEAGTSAFPEALRHPWATGLLLALSAGLWIHSGAPLSLRYAIGLALLAPWLFVVRGLLPNALRRPLAGLLVLVLLEVARRILVEFTAISRLLLVVETTVAFAGALWLRRPARLAHVPEPESPFWLNALAVWLRIFTFAAGFAMLGALFGWVNLADVLASTVVQATFAGSIAYAGTLSVEGIAESMASARRLSRIRLVSENRHTVLRIVRGAARTLAVATWLYVTLSGLGLWEITLERLGKILATPVGYGNFNLSLGGLLAFGVTLWVSWLLSRLVAAVLQYEVFSRVLLPRGVPFALSTISRYALLVIGFVVAMGALGFELSNVALIVSALGVGIGFGLQNVVNNFISGLILLFERPIKVGDMISIDMLMGEVSRIGIRASIVRTFDGAEVIIPNGDLLSGRVTNWTLSDQRRRVTLPVGVAYGTQAPQVLELLERVGKAHPDVLSTPPPMALFIGFGESSLDFELRFWTESLDALTVVRSQIAVSLQEALAEAGIEVPFPQRDLHVKSLPATDTGAEPG